MIEFENRNIVEIRVLRTDFHDWLESKIPDVEPGDNVISFEVDPVSPDKFLIKIKKE